jgi:hypothetical protein
MRGRHFLGAFAGAAGGLVLSLASGLILGVALVAYQAMQGVPLARIPAQMDAAHLMRSLPFLFASLGFGACATMCGGFIAGWIARSLQVATGAVAGVIGILISLPFCFWYPYPLWFNVAGAVTTLGSAVLGGYVAQLIFGRRRASSVTAS